MDSDEFSTRGPTVMGVSAATLALCSLFVGLRLISRFAVVRKPGWDDYTMILAWLLAFGASFAICYGASKGLGRRQEDIPREWLKPMKQSSFVFSVLYVGCVNHVGYSGLNFDRTLRLWRPRPPSWSSILPCLKHTRCFDGRPSQLSSSSMSVDWPSPSSTSSNANL